MRFLLFGLALVLSMGCGPRNEKAQPPAIATKSADVALEMPHPRAGRGKRALSENEACEGCHRDVAEEWRASLHRVSESSPAYRRAFSIEPMPFCTGCHAPEAENPAEEVPSEVAAVGVGCVTCHVVGGEILAAPSSGISGNRAPSSAHAVRRTPLFATAMACANCHEFEFPDRANRLKQEFMQSTVSEHQASPFASRSCADCHMPRLEGSRRKHDFRVSRDEALIRSAARVEASRPSASRFVVRFTPNELGHAFPTGDLFRRIEVLAEVMGDDYSLIEERSVYLARHFENRRQRFSMTRVLREDNRIFPSSKEGTTVELDLGPLASGRSVAYRIAYQRVDNTRLVDDPNAPMDGEVLLAQGVIPP